MPEAGVAHIADASEVLRVRDLVVSYGAVAALRGVSLYVGRGEVVALLGANGAGKSTMLRTISGLMLPKSGEIRFLSLAERRTAGPLDAVTAWAARHNVTVSVTGQGYITSFWPTGSGVLAAQVLRA